MDLFVCRDKSIQNEHGVEVKIRLEHGHLISACTPTLTYLGIYLNGLTQLILLDIR